ncbi:MAG: hypothetical protein Q7Q71_08445 [Verrucomicrobiota bacterium JB023]|nr:hypothetical protein [Verrucomicrobiota bacterium JB023]
MKWRWDWNLLGASLAFFALAALERANRARFALVEAEGELEAPLSWSPVLLGVSVTCALAFVVRLILRARHNRS